MSNKQKKKEKERNNPFMLWKIPSGLLKGKNIMKII